MVWLKLLIALDNCWCPCITSTEGALRRPKSNDDHEQRWTKIRKTKRQKDRQTEKFRFLKPHNMSKRVDECRKRHENHSKDMIDISRQWQIHGQRQTQRQERRRRRRMSESQRVGVGHHNFWSIGLDDLWSRKICRPKMNVWSQALYSSQMILFDCHFMFGRAPWSLKNNCRYSTM